MIYNSAVDCSVILKSDNTQWTLIIEYVRVNKIIKFYLIFTDNVKRPKGQAGSRGPSEERGTMNVNSIQGC